MTGLLISESEGCPRGGIDCKSAENQVLTVPQLRINAACVHFTSDSAFDAGRRNIVVVPVGKVRDTDFVSWASFDNSAQPQQMVDLSLICLGELNLRTLQFLAIISS
jgi:hypothetical protein